MIHSYYSSPIGELLLTGNGHQLVGLYTAEHVRLPVEIGLRSDAEFADVHRQLDEYFGGNRVSFDLPLAPRGTEFQRQVWQQLQAIEFGSTRSYRQLASRIGNSEAVRAVGLANGRNPISIIIPCHRVIGSNGALTGYAGGLSVKQWLLTHERTVASRLAQAG